MNNRFILTDGLKSANLLLSDDPAVWSTMSSAAKSDDVTLYARVAAAFRAYNLKANTVGNMPFCLYKAAPKDAAGKPKSVGIKAIDDTAEGDEFDNSATWENKVGFLPNPSELFRLNTLSYIATNTIYNLRTSDILGYKTKGLYHAVPHFFQPYTNPTTTQLEYIERWVGALREVFQPDDKRLVRMWRLDHTTEVLPSPNTEARAIENAAGIVFHADTWINHFFRRGGIAPTVIAMKGAVGKDVKEREESAWDKFMRGLGGWTSKVARVFNADALDVKQLGSSVTDLKENNIYEQAIAGIAMGTGMPLSLLMANSANYATAKEEKATWYENDIIPLCNWMAYEYNRQVFEPMGLYMEFHPETLDPQQEDETERAQAMMQYAGVLEKVQSKEIFMGLAAMMGAEVPPELADALDKHFAEKEAREEEMRQQMQAGGYVVGADGKPVPAQVEKDEDGKPIEEGKKPEAAENGKERQETAELNKEDDDEEKKPKFPAKWVPNLDQLRELQRWQELAFRKLKRAEPLTFEWRNDTLPEHIYQSIRVDLERMVSEEGIKAAFDMDNHVFIETQERPEPPAVKSEDAAIYALAESLNRYTEAAFSTKQEINK